MRIRTASRFVALASTGAVALLVSACGGGGGTPTTKDLITKPDAPMCVPVTTKDLGPADYGKLNDLGTLGDSGLKTGCSMLAQNCPTVMGQAQACIPYAVDANFHVQTACISAGTAAPGASCDEKTAATACEKGAMCLGNGTGSGGTCFGICGACDPANSQTGCVGNTPRSCKPGSCPATFCVGLAVDQKMNNLAMICETSCDIFNPTTCVDPTGKGGSCYAAADAPFCLTPGKVAVGGTCTNVNDCVPGSSCFGTGSSGSCLQTCRVGAVKSGCPSGKMCVDLTNPSLPGLGICM